MAIPISTPGRLGFYVDYSELSAPGKHTFYICRTHGSAGAVSCSYASGGDPHTNVSGTLTWADGQADIKWVTVEVPTKTVNGDHRIWLHLSSPTGGAALHFGSSHTRAYGVIDDGTIADDSDAVFYDSAAGGGGNGTQANPYNSIYTAITNIGSKRYLYGRGTTVPDGTNRGGPYSGLADCIFGPASRASETDRLYIRNWPGSTWIIDGQDTPSKMGFLMGGGEAPSSGSYHTYRGIDFTDLHNDVGPGSGIWYHYASYESINVEFCTFKNIDGSENNGGANLYGIDGAKIWRCTFDNIMKDGNNTNANTGGVYTYDGKNMSIQRCEFANAASGVYQKRVENLLDVSVTVRFCKCKASRNVKLWRSGGNPGHSYTIVQGNYFNKNTGFAVGHDDNYLDVIPKRHWWCCNVCYDIYSAGQSYYGAFSYLETFEASFFNNIFHTTGPIWSQPEDFSSRADTVEYSDYNHTYNLTSSVYVRHDATTYGSAAALEAATGFAANDTSGDPRFTNLGAEDLTLQGDSPCLNAGVDGTDQGIYLTGIEVLGA